MLIQLAPCNINLLPIIFLLELYILMMWGIPELPVAQNFSADEFEAKYIIFFYAKTT